MYLQLVSGTGDALKQTVNTFNNATNPHHQAIQNSANELVHHGQNALTALKEALGNIMREYFTRVKNKTLLYCQKNPWLRLISCVTISYQLIDQMNISNQIVIHFISNKITFIESVHVDAITLLHWVLQHTCKLQQLSYIHIVTIITGKHNNSVAIHIKYMQL